MDWRHNSNVFQEDVLPTIIQSTEPLCECLPHRPKIARCTRESTTNGMNYEPLSTFYANTLFIEKLLMLRGWYTYKVCVDLNPPHATEVNLQIGTYRHTETWTTFHLSIFSYSVFLIFVQPLRSFMVGWVSVVKGKST